MTKDVFLRELTKRLRQLPADEVERQRAYYDELLADMMEDGLSEEDAVDKLGDLSEIADEILKDTPLPALVKNRIRPKNGWTTTAVVLTVLGAPLWIPLLLALIMTAAALFLAFWAVIAALFITVIAFVLAGVLVIGRGFALFPYGMQYVSFAVGSGLLVLGLSCLAFLAAEYASVGLFRGGRWLFRAAKGLLILKEGK